MEFSYRTKWYIIWDNNNWKCPASGIYFDPEPNMEGASLFEVSEKTPDDYNPSHDIPDEKLRELENAARFLYENTEYSICCGETIEDLQVQPGGTTAWYSAPICQDKFFVNLS